MQRTQNNKRQALAGVDDAAGSLHGHFVADFLGSLDERLSALDGAAAQGDSASVL